MKTSIRNATTRNGAISLDSTGNTIVNLFARGGAMRSSSPDEILNLFISAFETDPQTAIKVLFYLRDCRGGQGERRFFRIILNWLGNNAPDFIANNISIISEYARFDDLFSLIGTKSQDILISYIKEVWERDKESQTPSLALKWFPSINTSSKETRSLAKIIIRSLGLRQSEYRRTLSQVRERLRVVERDMCSKSWGTIDYSKIPSRAGFLYRKAFRKHDEQRYTKFLQKVTKGEVKINTSVLYPYDIISKIISPYEMDRIGDKYYTKINRLSEDDRREINVFWDNLPDYLQGKEHNAICVVDTSGSMKGAPICAALGLGLYFAERNTGYFGGKFITFSQEPTLQNVKGKDIYEKVDNLRKCYWNQNTNLQKVFDIILNNGIKHNVPPNKMPREIIIISDMQFDVACASNNKTNFEEIKKKYQASGYSMPVLVFWNVNAIQKDFPVEFNQYGVKLVSGYSASAFQSIMSDVNTPLDLVMSVVNTDRYNKLNLG